MSQIENFALLYGFRTPFDDSLQAAWCGSCKCGACSVGKRTPLCPGPGPNPPAPGAHPTNHKTPKGVVWGPLPQQMIEHNILGNDCH